MSIFYITGKPGGGKSYIAVAQLCEELKDTARNRFIVTNLPLNLGELAVWCHENIKEEVNLSERVRVLDDSETGEFWLYEPHHKFEKRRALQFGRRTMEVPDFSERERGCLYIIDEVHIYFGAREWQATGSDCTYFLSQHRKIGCDVILVTQHPEQTDKALRRLAQEYMVVRNLSREPVFGFRIANFFRTIRMLNSPTSPNPAPFDSGFVKLRPEVYGKLYDTTAGVGIAGRLAPSNEQRGIHWYWLGAPLAAVVVFFVWLFTHLNYVQTEITSHFMRLATSGFKSAMAHPMLQVPHSGLANVNPLPAPLRVIESPGPAASSDGVNEAVSTVYCSGYVVLGKLTMVFLSDGRIARLDWGDVQYIRAEKVGVFGSSFPVYTTAQIERLNPPMTAAGTPSGLPPNQPQFSSVSSQSPPIILPNRDYRANLHDIKTASFQKPNSGSSASQY